jgi:predicted outer membrane protein
MNRRTTLIAPVALLGTAALLKSRVAFADDATTSSGGLTASAYTHQVLQYGTLSKEVSKIARANASTDYVNEFAHGEILEQTAVAQALTKSANPKPVALTEAQEKDLEKVQKATSTDFEHTYLTVEIHGHEALLKLQDDFLGANPVYSENLVHIALISRAFIKNHLYILRQLQAAYG